MSGMRSKWFQKFKHLLLIQDWKYSWGNLLMFEEDFARLLSYTGNKRALFKSFRGKLVLDIGCNRMYLSEKVRELGGEYVGLDVIRYRTKKDVSVRNLFVLADGAQIPFKDNTFDIVCMIETLEHIPDHVQALKEAYRVLKIGGGLFIQTSHAFKDALNFHRDRTHFHLFSAITLYRLLDYVGFQIWICERIGHSLVVCAEKVENPVNDHEPYLITRVEAYQVVKAIRDIGIEAVPSGRVFVLGWSDNDLDIHILEHERRKGTRLCREVAHKLFYPFTICIMCWQCEKSYRIRPNGEEVEEFEWNRPLISIHVEASRKLYQKGYTILDLVRG